MFRVCGIGVAGFRGKSCFINLIAIGFFAGVLVADSPAQSGYTNLVLSLDGTTGCVTVPNDNAFLSPNFTVEAWVRLNQLNSPEYIMGKGYNVNNGSLSLYAVGSYLSFGVFEEGFGASNGGAGLTPEGTITTNLWTHVAGIYDVSNQAVSVAINGVFAFSQAYTSSPPLLSATEPVTIGAHNNGASYFLSGQLDEVRFWNTALSLDEIRARMYSRLTGTESNLVAYWNFDDGTANDLTGHGHNGTLIGNAQIIPIGGVDVVHGGGVPSPATATAIVTNGFIIGVALTGDGNGYTNTPAVRIIGGGGSGAQAVAVVTNGVVIAVNILGTGSGYTGTPVVVIAPPFIPQPTIAISALLFGPLVPPVIELNFANLSPYDQYQLEFSPAATAPWTNLGSPFVPTATTSIQYVSGTGNAGFLRVEHLP